MANTGHRLTAPEKAKIVALLKQGLTTLQIAEVVNCTRQTVYNVARQNGLNLNRSSKSYNRGPKLAAKDRAQIIALYEQGETVAEIAKAVGCSPSMASKLARQEGLTLRKPQLQIPQPPPPTQVRAAWIQAYERLKENHYEEFVTLLAEELSKSSP